GEAALPAENVAEVRESLKSLMLTMRDKAPDLKNALSDADPRVRVLALRALEEMGAARQQFERAAAKGAVLPNVGDPLLEGLKIAFPAVLQELTDPVTPEARLKAIDVVETMGRDALAAVPILVRDTADPDRFVRWAAARTLGEIGPADLAETVP